MRAKPDMKPWGHTKRKVIVSPARAALLHSPGRNEGEAQYETLGTHKTKGNISPARAELLHSPGCNEGKARYETLGIHEPKVISSSVGAAL